MQGTVRKLVKERGFGFIRSEEGKDVFFHRSEMFGVKFEQLEEGDQVTFTVESAPKGLRARSVTTPHGPYRT